MKKTTSYLYEGLTPKNKNSMMLWESAGRVIAEAQLNPQQILNLFQQIEQGATGAGGNRTGLGITKDAAAKVQSAYNDLVSKVQNSGPMKNADAAYDDVAEKLKQATGGDKGVMQYVQKYRTFAKAHPVAQTLIYSALIAAAGISGAGAGGAAALGLLKMTDKLLQGEEFSTAAGQGLKTGGMAYAAGALGKAMKGGDTTTTSSSFSQHTTGLQPASPWDIPSGVKQQFPLDKFSYKTDGIDLSIYDKAGKLVATRPSVDAMESIVLSSAQVNQLFEHILIAEGLFDKFKTAAANVSRGIAGKHAQGRTAKGTYGKAGLGDKAANLLGKGIGAVKNKAQTVGHNLTTKVTADKLQAAWKAAGSPTDSEAIVDILQKQGIDPAVISDAMKAINITKVDRSRLPDISKLTLQQKQALLKQLDALDAKQNRPKAINRKAVQVQSRDYKEFKYLVDGIKARI